MPCVCYSEPDLQNAYFEGFTQAVEVTNLFVRDFNEEIIHPGINYPGSCHDSKLAFASVLYHPLLTERTPAGFAVLVDSAFPRVAK